MQFPLFKATVAEGYAGRATCTACRREGQECLWLDGRDHLVVACRRCGERMGLRVDWRETQCPRCGESNLWPADFAMGEAAACYDCLRDGRAAVSHDSELGRSSGRTHTAASSRGGARRSQSARGWKSGWTTSGASR